MLLVEYYCSVSVESFCQYHFIFQFLPLSTNHSCILGCVLHCRKWSTSIKWTFICIAYWQSLTNYRPSAWSSSMGLYMVVECEMCHKSRAWLDAHKGGRKSWQRVVLTWVDGYINKVQIVGQIPKMAAHHVQSTMKRIK